MLYILPLALATQVFLLVVVLSSKSYLQKKCFSWLGEASFAIMLGVAVGVIAKLVSASSVYREKISFNENIFIYFFLPVIIFDAGYSVDRKLFVKQLDQIFLLAVPGTVISFFVFAVLMWSCSTLDFGSSSIFGALISATDPVAVLAVLSRLGASRSLYITTFGESVLNDAVGAVLYDTAAQIYSEGHAVGAKEFFLAVLSFVCIFVGSILIGFVFAVTSAWSFKRRIFASSVMIPLMSYLSYVLAASFGMSGIVSLLVCAAMMRAYVTPQMDEGDQHKVHHTSQVLGEALEMFVCLSVGLTASIATDGVFSSDEALGVEVEIGGGGVGEGGEGGGEGEGETLWSIKQVLVILSVSLLGLAVSRLCNVSLCLGLSHFIRRALQSRRGREVEGGGGRGEGVEGGGGGERSVAEDEGKREEDAEREKEENSTAIITTTTANKEPHQLEMVNVWKTIPLLDPHALSPLFPPPLFPPPLSPPPLSPPPLSPPSSVLYRQGLLLWWAGLRGGMAVALATSAAATFGSKGAMIRLLTVTLSVLTSVVNGGCTPYLLKKCNLLEEGEVGEGEEDDRISEQGQTERKDLEKWPWENWIQTMDKCLSKKFLSVKNELGCEGRGEEVNHPIMVASSR